jgi:hypothetical protein
VDGNIQAPPAPPTEEVNGVAIPQFARNAPAAVDTWDGLDGLTGVAFATGGRLFNVVNTPDVALDRIISTLAGYYLLGVESMPVDLDGQPKPIEVTVNRPGVTVSARKLFVSR